MSDFLANAVLRNKSRAGLDVLLDELSRKHVNSAINNV